MKSTPAPAPYLRARPTPRSASCFPTELRATGIGVSIAAGRLGGMVGVVGLSFAMAGLGLVSAFVMLAVFFGIGAIAALLWGRRGGIEARGLSLDAVAPVGAT